MTLKIINSRASAHSLPFYQSPAACGFTSPAADYLQDTLSLDQLLIQHPAATFFVQAQGGSMRGAGIHEGDVLVIDRSLEARDNDVIIALMDGELIIKRLRLLNGRAVLQPEDAGYAPVELTPDHTFDLWGVVTAVIHRFR